MKKFKQFGGFIIDDIKQYTKNYLEKYPDIEIYVGSDSLNSSRFTKYVTVICYVHPGHGAHVIFKRYLDNKIKVKKHEYAKRKNLTENISFWKQSLFPRMWKEVEDSANTALEIKDIVGNKLITVDLDLNPYKEHQSNIAHDAGYGYITSLGFKCRTKPNAFAASCAADFLVK